MDERVRYITVRMISPIQIQEKDVWYIISSEIRRLFGTFGAAQVGLFLSHYDEKNQGGIFRSSHKYVHRVRAALCFIHGYQNHPLFIITENVTGSLKKAKELLKERKNLKRWEKLRELLYTKRELWFDDEEKYSKDFPSREA
jgi:RNase P/RNase MRP subunit POP5